MPRAQFFELAPDWACEVLSPRTLRCEGERVIPAGSVAGDARVRAETFETFEVELGALWRG